MQTLNFSEIKSVDGKLSIRSRIEGIYKFGFSWPNDLNAQDVFTNLLQRDLDQRSVLVRNFKLPEIDVTIPFLLIGPPGVRMILISRERGMFRAKDKQWLIHSGKGFKPTRDNLIVRTQALTKATQEFFNDNGFGDVIVDGLIVGVNPGMHVETHHSAVRVIQSDAIRRFGNQWNQDIPELSPEQIYQIVYAIKRAATQDDDEKLEKKLAEEPYEDKFAKSLEPIQKVFNFDSRQWLILGSLIAATVIVLLIFILFIVLSL